MDLAVVVVDYNAGEYLTACLRSVFEHAGGAELEVVVVDNASRDLSGRIAKDAFPQIGLIETGENRGFAAGVNVGLRATTAPYVFVLNPDAEVWEGTLAGLVKLADERPRAGAIGPMIRNSDGTVYPSGRRVPPIGTALGHAFLGTLRPDNRWSRGYRMADWDRTTEREVDWISGAAFLLRRDALDEVGLLDERFFLYAEEVDLFKRLREAGWSIVFTPELEVVHEQGVSTGRSRRMHLIHSESVYRYFEKHHAHGWRRVLLPFAKVALRARAELESIWDRLRGMVR
ncbi:MAG: glycosyltransferase family 2 protein [Solirubrobacterales bacterium]